MAVVLVAAAVAACGDDGERSPEISCDQVAEHVVETFADQMIDSSREASLARVQVTCAGNRMPQSVRRCILDARTMDTFIACTESWARPVMEERREQEIERLRRVREHALRQKRELDELGERLERLEKELEAAEGAIEEATEEPRAGDGAAGEGAAGLSGGDPAGGL